MASMSARKEAGAARLRRWGWLLIALFGAVLVDLHLLALSDMRILDAQFQWLRDHRPREVERDVVLVGMDDATTTAFPEPMSLWHRHLGDFLMAMAELQPSVVGFDLVLPERSYDPVLPGSDRALLEGMLATRGKVPLIFGLTVDPDGNTRRIYPPFLSVAGRDSTGYVFISNDPSVSADQVARYFDERLGADDSWRPTLAGQMARRIKREPSAGYIDFSRGAPIEYVPIHTIVQAYREGALEPLRAQFAGHPVLVGGVYRFDDRHFMPVNLAAWEEDYDNNSYTPGVFLHVQALRSFMTGGTIQPLSRWQSLALVFVIALLWQVRPGNGRSFVVAFALVGTLVAGSTLALFNGLLIPVASFGACVVLALGGRIAFEGLLQARERQALKQAFGGYVSPSIMEEILAGRLGSGLGGARHNLCVLFADIRNFTTRSETLPPEGVISLLNRYFEEVTAVIHQHGGTIDKFLGDGVMAFFGAPKDLGNPSVPAFAAARELLAKVDTLNQVLAAEGLTPIEIGIGLHSGEAVVGHIGSTARHEYTAIGDTVNVASRLEGVTKEVGFPLVCSRAVADAIGGDGADGLRALGARPIKGHQPVEVFGWRPGSGANKS
jgi:class 3 adenylate cyclase/CHASE2 domain-containing sensor protein